MPGIMLRIFYYIFFIFSIYPAYSQNTIDEFINHADSLLKSGDTTACIEFLLIEHEQDRSNLGKEYLEATIGELYLKINKLDLSMRYLQMAIEKDQNDYVTYYNLACLSAKKDNITTSLDYLEKSIKTGWDDYKWLMSDTDLENVRKDKRFETLENNYFSKNDREALALFKKAEEYYKKGWGRLVLFYSGYTIPTD